MSATIAKLAFIRRFFSVLHSEDALDIMLHQNECFIEIVLLNLNHPDIFAAISMDPTTVFKPWAVALDEDVCSNLTSQLGALAEKEWEVLQGGK